MLEYLTVPPEEPDSQFCSALEAARPANCQSAPSVPGFDPNWQPNGCGSEQGSWGESLAGSILYPYTLNQPMAGADFTSACNGHDECWGNASPRLACDAQFEVDLGDACAGTPACMELAQAYVAAVGSSTGTANYDSAVAARQCAEWHHDKAENHCP